MSPAHQCPVQFALPQWLHWMIWQDPEPRSNEAGRSSFSSTVPRAPHGQALPTAWPRIAAANPAAGLVSPESQRCSAAG